MSFDRPLLVDRLGVVASAACAVHCVGVALVPAVLAAAGLSALLAHDAEWTFTLVAVGFAALALVMSWRRHGALEPVLAFAIGITGLLAARFLEEAGSHGLGTTMAVCSGAVLVLGHALSLRLRRRDSTIGDDAPCCAPE